MGSATLEQLASLLEHAYECGLTRLIADKLPCFSSFQAVAVDDQAWQHKGAMEYIIQRMKPRLLHVSIMSSTHFGYVGEGPGSRIGPSR